VSPLLQSNLPGLALGTYSATDPQSAPEIITATGYWGPWLAGERYATGAEVHNAFDGGQYIALNPSLGVRPDTEPASWIAVGSLVAISGEVATYREGLAAARPAASVKGRIYYATDTGTYSLDTGTAWNAIVNPNNKYAAVKTYNKAEAEAGVEPSATRMAWVMLSSAEEFGTSATKGVEVGGVLLEQAVLVKSLAFLVPAGQKWTLTSIASVKANTVLL
jgi:hypothetical protein